MAYLTGGYTFSERQSPTLAEAFDAEQFCIDLEALDNDGLRKVINNLRESILLDALEHVRNYKEVQNG